MDKKYYDVGGLFPPKIKSANAPDYRGDIELSPELCSYIARKAKNGEEVKISIGLWPKQWQYGEYFSAKITQPFERKEEPRPKVIDDSDIPF